MTTKQESQFISYFAKQAMNPLFWSIVESCLANDTEKEKMSRYCLTFFARKTCYLGWIRKLIFLFREIPLNFANVRAVMVILLLLSDFI
jgi:hypothetical protein